MKEVVIPWNTPLRTGLHVIISEHLGETKCVLKRMCRSKKVRIRKKWLKSSRNYHDVPDPKFYNFGERGTLICNRVGYELLKQRCKESSLMSG